MEGLAAAHLVVFINNRGGTVSLINMLRVGRESLFRSAKKHTKSEIHFFHGTWISQRSPTPLKSCWALFLSESEFLLQTLEIADL